jgi:hypothetical protein
MASSPDSAPGTRQHFLPAAFIGRFSTATTGRTRRRRVWTVRRASTEPELVSAQDVGFRWDLYTLVGTREQILCWSMSYGHR